MLPFSAWMEVEPFRYMPSLPDTGVVPKKDVPAFKFTDQSCPARMFPLRVISLPAERYKPILPAVESGKLKDEFTVMLPDAATLILPAELMELETRFRLSTIMSEPARKFSTVLTLSPMAPG